MGSADGMNATWGFTSKIILARFKEFFAEWAVSEAYDGLFLIDPTSISEDDDDVFVWESMVLVICGHNSTTKDTGTAGVAKHDELENWIVC